MKKRVKSIENKVIDKVNKFTFFFYYRDVHQKFFLTRYIVNKEYYLMSFIMFARIRKK